MKLALRRVFALSMGTWMVSMSPEAEAVVGVMPFLLSQFVTAWTDSAAGATCCSTWEARCGCVESAQKLRTYLGFGKVVTVVLARRITDVEEGGLEAGCAVLGHGNREAEHARGGEGVEAEAEGHRGLGRANDQVGMHCAGPAERKRKEGRKSEQTCCNHCEQRSQP